MTKGKSHEEMKFFSWQRWSAESSSHSCRPWCRPQACFSGRSHSPKRQYPGAVHCRPRGHQSHPEQEGRTGQNCQLCPDGRKSPRCSFYPLSWDHLPRGLILHEPLLFPWKCNPQSPYQFPILSPPSLQLPSFLRCRSTGPRRGENQIVQCCPANPAPFKVSFYYIPPQKGIQMDLFAQSSIFLTLPITTGKIKFTIYPKSTPPPS